MTRRRKAGLWATVGLDALLINVAFVLSYIIRYQLELPYPVDPEFYAPFTPYIPFAVLLTVLALVMFRVDGLYDARRHRRWLSDVYRILSGTATSIVSVMAFTFFVQPLVYSRGMLVLAGALIVFFLSTARLIENSVKAGLRRRGIGVEGVLVVGAGEVGRAVMRTILANPRLGYRIAGYLDDDPAKHGGLGRIKCLGGTDCLLEAVRAEDVSEVIIALPWTYHRKIMGLVELGERAHVRARLVPDVFQQRMGNVDLESLNGIPLISPNPEGLTPSGRISKRVIDLLLSVLVLPFFILIYAVVALLIKLDSPGPVIFRQARVGRNGRVFQVLKFRTMVDGADEMKEAVAHLSKYKGDTLLKVPDDPRMTRAGRFLRRTSIDELPQIVNVLRGEMSWVGPRPNTPDEVSHYERWQRKRLSVLPGITGLWQVSGRSDVPFDEMCLLDIFYIENWSVSLDTRIMLQTIPHVLFGNGAY
jgi:exopolysaccharide biosynthesis polyprenyl glycosylphosphotransferase